MTFGIFIKLLLTFLIFLWLNVIPILIQRIFSEKKFFGTDNKTICQFVNKTCLLQLDGIINKLSVFCESPNIHLRQYTVYLSSY